MQIDKIMHRNVKIIGPDETLRDVATAMKKLDVGVLPVGEHDKLVGMITDRDIAILGIAEGKGPDNKAREVMSHEVKYCFTGQRLTWEVFHQIRARTPLLQPKLRLPYQELQALAVL